MRVAVSEASSWKRALGVICAVRAGRGRSPALQQILNRNGLLQNTGDGPFQAVHLTWIELQCMQWIGEANLIQDAGRCVGKSFGFHDIHAKARERTAQRGKEPGLIASYDGQQPGMRLALNIDGDALAQAAAI